MKRFSLLLLFLGFLPRTAHAYGYLDSSQVLYVGTGLMASNAGRLASAPTGGTSMTSALLPALTVTAFFTVGHDWMFSPMVSYTLLGHKSPEGGEKTTFLPISLRFEKSLGLIGLRAGPGVLIHTISGNGGTAVLNNGTSTSTFGLPGDSASARLFFVNAGFGFSSGRIRVDLDALVTGAFSSMRRAVNLMANVSYGLF